MGRGRLGEQAGGRHAGDGVDLQDERSRPALDIRDHIHARKTTAAQRAVRGAGQGLDLDGECRRNLGGGNFAADARLVFGLVVIEAAFGRNDLGDGQRDQFAFSLKQPTGKTRAP